MENKTKSAQKKKNLYPDRFIENELQPERYRFFDDNYARKKNQWIANGSIRKRLYQEALLAKIVFHYKKHHNFIYCLDGDFFNVEGAKLELYDIFAHVNITSCVAKIIARLKRKNKLVSILGDVIVLNYYYSESNCIFRKRFGDFTKRPDYLACLHPYIRHALITSDSELLGFMDDKDYKKSEADFVRTANSNRQKINDFLTSKFIVNKKIFICRFDVFFRGDRGASEFVRCSVQHYKKQVQSLFDSFWGFDHALDVIFPTAILTGEMIRSYSPVGQIVLVSTDRVSANQKRLKEFASQAKRCELLDFMPAEPLPKDLVPNVDGVLEFTPSTVEAIGWLADFLTIERRFVAPGQGCTDGSGTAHCFRFIDL